MYHIFSHNISHLALGYDRKEAVKLSKEYITEVLRHSFDMGRCVGPIHHFYRFATS